MLKSKWMWLLAGVLCGTIFSASSEERKTRSLDMKVVAVSLEDAEERAQELLLEEEHPSLDRAKVLAVFRPRCESGEGDHSFYQCSAKVLIQ